MRSFFLQGPPLVNRDLIIGETINLDFFNFQENENTADISNQIYSRNKNIEDEDSDIDFEEIYEEEFER